jgi:hypothetical protein
VEIIFLLAGLLFVAIGALIAISEMQARHGTDSVRGQVVGFSLGRSNRNRNSFHSVAEYVGPNGRTYYVEGSVASSVK